MADDALLNTTAMLNAAIRIVRSLKGPEPDCLLWAEQVKSNMALIHGAPDFSHAQHVVEVEQLNKELYEALRTVLQSASPNPKEHPTMTAAWEIGRATLAKARGEGR